MTTQPKTHTFRGRTVSEAMQKVVAELGRDAFIVDKRHVRNRRLGGLLGGEEVVEIIASTEALSAQQPSSRESGRRRNNALAKAYAPPVSTDDDEMGYPENEPPMMRVVPESDEEDVMQSVAVGPENHNCAPTQQQTPYRPDADTFSSQTGGMASGASGMSAMSSAFSKLSGGGAVELGGSGGLGAEAMLQSVRSEILRLMSTQARGGAPAVGERLLDLYHRLVENDVASDLARQLVEQIQQKMPGVEQLGEDAVRQALCEAIGRVIHTSGPIKLKPNGPTIVTLVGPTGVGKTTTIVKLAFEFKLRQNRRVALLSEDLHRPGAEAQLRSMAQVLGVPLYTIDNPERVGDMIARLGEMDLILIDTAGRAPRDEEGMQNLSAFLKIVRPDETHLVLSGESSDRFAKEATEKFKAVGYDRVVLSKLDEAASYGLILNVANRVQAELSYITTGQEMATTIRLSDQELLARLVAGMDRIGHAGTCPAAT